MDCNGIDYHIQVNDKQIVEISTAGYIEKTQKLPAPIPSQNWRISFQFRSKSWKEPSKLADSGDSSALNLMKKYKLSIEIVELDNLWHSCFNGHHMKGHHAFG